MAFKYQVYKPGDVEEDDPSYQMGNPQRLEGVGAIRVPGRLEVVEDVSDLYPVQFPDVSSWQGVIDWTIMSTKTDVIYIRAGYGNNGFDPKALENCANARAHGILFGLYWYVKAGKDFRMHIESFQQVIQEVKPNLPSVFDCEFTDYTTNVKNLTTQWLAKLYNNWTATRDNPIIYTRATWWNEKTYRTDWPKTCKLWTAHYTSAAQPAIPDDWGKVAVPRTWTFWQYSANGNGKGDEYGVDGSYDIDLNRFNGTAEQFEDLFGVALPQPDPEPPDPEPPDPEPEPEECGTWFEVITNTLNVRKGPGLSYEKIDTLTKGDIVQALRIGGTDVWIQVDTGSDQGLGWCAVVYQGKPLCRQVE